MTQDTEIKTYDGYAKIGNWELRQHLKGEFNFEDASELIINRMKSSKPELFNNQVEVRIKLLETDEVRFFKLKNKNIE